MKRISPTTRPFTFESFEPRLLFAGFAFINDKGVLIVNGTESEDTILMSNEFEGIVVTRNGKRRVFDPDEITKRIRINGNGGPDEIGIGGMLLEARISGGQGDDRITGSDLGCILYGRGGDDTLEGGERNDTIHGGTGDDRLIAGNGRNTLHGDTGADTFFTRNGLVDKLFGGGGVDKAQVDEADDQTRSIGELLA